MTVRILLLCFAAGLGGGAIDAALSPLRGRAGRVFTILSDVLIALLSVGAHAAVLYFYCDGRIFVYAVLAQILGFIVCSRLFAAFLRKVGKKLPRKKKRTASPLA